MQTALWPATWGYYLSSSRRVDERRTRLGPRHARRHLRPAGRCRRCAAAASPTASCRSRRSTAGPPPATTPRPAERLRQLLVGLRDQVWRPAHDRRQPRRPQRRPRRRPRRRAARRRRQRRLRRPPGARPALPAPPAPVPRRGPRRASASSPACDSSRPTCPTASVLPARCRSPVRLRSASRPLGCRSCARRRRPAGLHRRAARRRSRRPRRAGARRRPCRCSTRCSATACCASTPRPRARLLAGPDRPLGQLLADAELVDLVPAPAPTADLGLAAQPAGARRHPAAHGAASISAGLADFAAPEVRSLGEFREALALLAAADPAAVERLLPAGLDATSYRLDAWVTSLATRRLAELRAAQPDRVSCSAATAGSRTCAPSRGAPVADAAAGRAGPAVRRRRTTPASSSRRR